MSYMNLSQFMTNNMLYIEVENFFAHNRAPQNHDLFL